jgi:hypothetical protein
MPVNGPETIADPKTSQPVPSEARSGRAAKNAKPAVGRGASTRRRRDRQDGSETNGKERFFLASENRSGDVPTLGRECATEAEAIIEAFREKVNLYRVTEFQTRADTQKGVGESASAVWKAVQEQHARLLPASFALDDKLTEELVAPPLTEVVTVESAAAALVFGARVEKESPRRRPVVTEADCQLSLF